MQMKSFNQFNYKRIIIVSYRLPFKLVRKKEEYFLVQNSGGLVSAILSLSEELNSIKKKFIKILWIGTGEKQLRSDNIHSKFDLYPVEIPHKINEKFYGGFCNDTIWPLFHYFPSRTAYDNSYYESYHTANNLFFHKVKGLIQPDDFIWIHDYHLFLLPELIREELPEANIGFFLHIPFPSFEIFRLLPRAWRESIIKGMIGADLIGFHTNDYTQHFIKSVKRILGNKIERNFISVKDRLCKADAFPIGIDFNKFHIACYQGKTVFYKNKLKNFLGEKKLIFSVDRLDFSKGFLFRLKAFERFLEKYPEWHFKVVFNMIVVPSRENVEEYKKLKTKIEAIVGRINGKYSNLSWRPIVYQYKSVSFNELVAIYDMSDVGLITSLRDGMNLVAKEYIACQRENVGMLVLSELAGASVELNESLIINPTDVEETSDAINKALIMPVGEKETRIQRMQNRLSRYDVFRWAKDFFDQLTEVKIEQKHLQVKILEEANLDVIYERYKKAHNRLFLIDYDGTLTPYMRLPELAQLDAETKKLMTNLSSESKNSIVIISGRDPNFIEEQFKNMYVTLIAEHGYFTKLPGDKWKANLGIDFSWKKKILPVLNDYVDRCNGSFIEEKHSSLVWHYRNAEEDVALLRINELKDDLYEILKSESKLQILDGDKVIEIKSILFDKGSAASNLMSQTVYDFILAIGDDSTDEDLFKIIPDTGFTIKVGISPTNARYNIEDQSRIIEILSQFVR